MALPASTVYKNGFWFKSDGTGPYAYNGTTLILVSAGAGPGGALSTGTVYKDGFRFKPNESGPYAYDGTTLQ